MKSFIRNHVFLVTVIISIINFIIFGTVSVISSRYFYYHLHHGDNQKITNISLDLSDESLVELDKIYTYNDETIVRVKSINSGVGTMLLSYNIESETEVIPCQIDTNIMVNRTKMIFVGDKLFDYTGFSVIHYSFMIYAGLMALYFWWLRREQQKESYYSFKSINYCSAIIFFTVLFFVYFLAAFTAGIKDYFMSAELVMLITKNFAMAYSLITIPFMTIFYISLAISNIELIRREGIHITHMLGIGIALLMAVGTGIEAFLFVRNLRYETVTPALSITYAVYGSAFSIFQVLLVSSMVTCLEAALRKISYDKDYIIILGCAIRKDGTLYPLLRGRVDRAISFWKEQYESTGKKAFFIPSGGQGADEIMPEGTAMKNYLIEQGFPQELILAETASTTTLENMKFSKNLIENKNENAGVVFSTTNYHVFRSGILAEQAKLKADGIGAHTKWYFWPNAMIREVIGMFAVQTKLQWIMTAVLILTAGIIEYIYLLLT